MRTLKENWKNTNIDLVLKEDVDPERLRESRAFADKDAAVNALFPAVVIYTSCCASSMHFPGFTTSQEFSCCCERVKNVLHSQFVESERQSSCLKRAQVSHVSEY